MEGSLRERLLLRAMVDAFARVVAGTALLLGGFGASNAQTTTAIEFYYADWDYYFVTVDVAEIAYLDGGGFGGVWKRTGEAFTVGGQPGAAMNETCRFFSTSFAPKSSHFYTPFPAECTKVKSSPDWQYEGVAFYVQPADATGICPAGTNPLYRLYNNGMGGAPNHRYTSARATVDAMHARGWTSEGNGPDVTFACLPVTAGSGATATGVWTGTTSLNETVRAIVLPDRTYYALHSFSGSPNDAGVIRGMATTLGGAFSSSDAVSYLNTSGKFGSPATVSGTYVSQGTLHVTIVDDRGARSLVATFVPGSDQAASLAAVAGSYAGYTAHAEGDFQSDATFTFDADGNLSGKNAGCAFKGTISPKPSINAFDWTVTSTQCVFGSAASGILYYDEATRQVHGFAPFSTHLDMFYLVGTKG